MKNLSGKRALVTGCSKGLGPVIAERLAQQGMNLVITARSVDKLDAVAESLRAHRVDVTCVAADLTQTDQIQSLADRALQAGPLDVLVNNAGLEEVVVYAEQDPVTIERIVQTNLLAPLLLSRAVLPHMIERGAGCIVNISSLAGKTGMPFGATYSGTKSGLAEWGLSINAELEGSGVTVSTICPGFVGGEGMFARKGKTPPRSLGQSSPDDVARAVVDAVHRGPLETLVASFSARVLMILKAVSPGLVLAIGRRAGLVSFLGEVAADRPGPTS